MCASKMRLPRRRHCNGLHTPYSENLWVFPGAYRSHDHKCPSLQLELTLTRDPQGCTNSPYATPAKIAFDSFTACSAPFVAPGCNGSGSKPIATRPSGTEISASVPFLSN